MKRIAALLDAITLAAAVAARAGLVHIVWDASGRFEHGFRVAPGKLPEACGRLAR
jgi:hypothetical protein